MQSLARITLVSLLAACQSVVPSAPDNEAVRGELREFGAHYGYDVGYMEQLLDDSRPAYDTFAAAMAMSMTREHLPVDAHYVACISALLADDCGQCTQLSIRMALEEGVDREVLRQLLEAPSELPTDLRLVHQLASQVVRGENGDSKTVAQLRKIYGDEAFGELTVNILGSRIYPALRRAMGAETACSPPSLDWEVPTSEVH
ncbi:MAG: hypothetical protein R3F33_06855 [Planctomycetota bacterium]